MMEAHQVEHILEILRVIEWVFELTHISLNLTNLNILIIVTTTTSTTSANITEETSNSSSGKTTEEHRRVGMIQKLKKLRHESSSHGIKPNVISFVKSGSKLLSRNRDHSGTVSNANSTKLERPKMNGLQNPATHRGIVYRSGVGIERAKDLVPRAAVLSDQKLSFYTDKGMSTLKEVIQLDTVYSIHLLQDVK